MRNTKRGARDGRKLVRTGALVLVLLLLAFCYMPPGRAMWTELRRACGLLPFAQSLPDADLTVYVIDVGKADAILIETPEGAVLSDCATAEQAKTVLRVLKQRNIQKLRAVWISHADSDHVGGLTQILWEMPAEEVVTSMYTELTGLPEDQTVRTVSAGETVSYGEAEFRVLAPSEDLESTNENSLVYKLCYKKFSVLFCGDIEEKAERLLLDMSGDTLRADVLKVPHHGSASATSDALLEAVQPQYAVISSGEDRYLLPRNETLQRLGLEHKIAIVGLAKRIEEVYFPHDPLPYYIDRNSEALKVLMHIRDEAHRFGITFHRKKRSLAFIRSELESIPTLGPRSVDKLLRHYRTVSNIRRASEEELSGLIGRQRAAEVIRYYSKAGELSVAHGTDGPSPSHDESAPSNGRAIPLTTAGKDNPAPFDTEGDGFAPKQRG